MVKSYKVLILLVLLAGCASTGTPQYAEPNWCKDIGGIWYKGPQDREWRCVDEDSLKQQLRRLQEIWT